MNILMTTVGKGNKNEEGRYSRVRYCFEDNSTIESSFVGFALYKWLKNNSKVNFDRILILGTSTSSWDALLEDIQSVNLELYEEIDSAINDKGVKPDILNKLEESLTRYFDIPVVCKIISSGENQQQQHQIFSTIWETVDKKDNLWMDMTHGFRIMPLLELFTALNMEEGKGIVIKGIYYGMLKQDAGSVVELSFTEEVSRWTRGIFALNLGHLDALLNLPGMEPYKDDLEHLLLYEEFNQIANAKKYAKNILKRLEKEGISCFSGELYMDRLIEYFKWVEDTSFVVRQFTKAEYAIEHKNYSQGIVLLNEAVITNLVPKGTDPMNYCKRKKAYEEYMESDKETDDQKLLRELRNTLSHGTRPSGYFTQTISKLMKDPDAMHKELKRLLKAVRKGISG